LNKLRVSSFILADHAVVVEGKAYINGAGWDTTTLLPNGLVLPSAVYVHVVVPWLQANEQHQFELSLVDADGQVICPSGSEPVTVSGPLEVGRPVGAVHGTDLGWPQALTLGPLPLRPGRYTWCFRVDGEDVENGSISFTVRGLAQTRAA
jgi:Family of unknown function (DUF6941)